MCTSGNGAMLPYALNVKLAHPTPYIQMPPSGVTQAALDLQRMQLLDYSARLRYGLAGLPPSAHPLAALYHPHADPLAQAYFLHKHDPRARFVHEEPKPSHSYIGLIAMAILSSKDKKLVLSDIYQWILDNYPYFRTRGPGWRNSIRHNLSLNDCFIKAGRSANGKGHYWAVHPANVDDFTKGDFRRRRAQRKVRKHMGLAVPDDEDDDDSPPPSNLSPPAGWKPASDGTDADSHSPVHVLEDGELEPRKEAVSSATLPVSIPSGEVPLPAADERANVIKAPVAQKPCLPTEGNKIRTSGPSNPSKRRLFDVESLLAPEPKYAKFPFEHSNVASNEEASAQNGSIPKNGHFSNATEALPEDLSTSSKEQPSPGSQVSQQTPSPQPRDNKAVYCPPASLCGTLVRPPVAPLAAPFGAYPGGLASPWRAVARPIPPGLLAGAEGPHNKEFLRKWTDSIQQLHKPRHSGQPE